MKKTIKDLIPFVSENLITIPLWEEGDYRPHLNIWLHFEVLPEMLVNRSEFLLSSFGLDSTNRITIQISTAYKPPQRIEFAGSLHFTNPHYSCYFDIGEHGEQTELSNFDIQPLIDVAVAVIEKLKPKK